MDYTTLANNGDLTDSGLEYAIQFQDEHHGVPSDELYNQLPADMPESIKNLILEAWSVFDAGTLLLAD